MEADWEIEIGGEAPVIDAEWSGFVDLRADPARVVELIESRQLPTLARTLIKLNAPPSPMWTSKTDVFEPENIDPYEVDGTREDVKSALSCYIDLLARDQRWRKHSEVELECRRICDRLHGIKLRRCRVDLVIRRAHLRAQEVGFGLTAYLTGCGKDMDSAKGRLSECLEALAGVLVAEE
jgi:hypothetical protein